MRRTFPTKPKHVHLVALSGLGKVRFLAVIEHGRGTREVAVDVPPESILKLADALRATAPVNGACPCDSKHAKYDHREEFLVGHAVWHVEHPEMPMPCVHDFIDMDALPAGNDDHDCDDDEDCQRCHHVGALEQG